MAPGRAALRAAACTAAALAVTLCISLPPAPQARAAAVLRVGLEAGGSFTWVLRVIQRQGLDRRRDVAFQTTRFATKAAAETALRGGEVDVKVDDWLFATWARSQGLRVQAVDGFSRAVGGIVVRADGPIRSVADLRGRRIAVTGAADKSYLVLRAVSTSQFGFDPQQQSIVLSAAPPLLNHLLDRGDTDAIVQYWQFIPGLVATGRFRELVSTAALVRRIAPDADAPFLVVVASDEAVRSRPDALRPFLAAVREGAALLASRRDLWDALFDEELLGIPDRGMIPALMARYRSGIPGPWNQATVDALARLTAKLVAVAGSEVLGVSAVDPAAYNVQLTAR
ncbi:MAG TPA: ABC transporter substrate-binding protein [bacterium]|nr:ABC transporter substrate-binding protein [bacterium]